MDATKTVVLLLCFAAAIAVPITQHESDKCSTECFESSKLKFNQGTTYVYDYRVDTESSVFGAFENSARLTLQTSVNIEAISQCEFALQLTSTRLFHTDASGALKSADREIEFRSEVEGSPLRFSFQNGIVDHVCAENEDSVRSLNLKKGILSAFQNSMDDLTQSQNMTETDVTGSCKTEYKLVSNGYYTTEVKKVKDMLSCTDRLDFLTMVQLTPYKVPSDLQNTPIMKTTHECDQTFENGGILKSSVCKESHVYRPFANGQNGGSTKITQTLTYQTYKYGISSKSDNTMIRTSLAFDHSEDHPNLKNSRKLLEKSLNEMCISTVDDIRQDTPKLFSDLIVAMKGVEKSDLTHFHQLLKEKTLCSNNERTYKYFFDALPMVSTSASISLMTELLTAKDVSGLEATEWLTSLAFIQYPTSDMLMNVKFLLENKDIRKQAMLPGSAMVNNFCKKMTNCDQNKEVISLMKTLESNIDDDCDTTGDKFELTLLTLKAIGNAGHMTRTIPVLNKCLTSASNLEIRIAAAVAFRRMPCNFEDEDLWETFTNQDIDSELRINAYLALMHCPTTDNLKKMVSILNSEADEQVGAFVYSHLTNLKETSDPHKQGVAEAIRKLHVTKEFDLNFRKYSRNLEVSGLLNKINTGVTAESNLIWSNKAEMIRSVSGNLTVQLFGQSTNLLDFGGRIEGLELQIKAKYAPLINSDFKLKDGDVKKSFYGRLFGNEMLFMHSETTTSPFGSNTPSWLDMVIKLAQKQHLAFTKSAQFMDMCMVIPSSAGLPIHMKVNGMATVDLNLGGKMDLRKVGSAPRSMDIDGEIRPSAALELTGSMVVDSFVTKTGLRMRNTMHTSTAMKGRIQLNRGQRLNLEIDTPEEKTEIFGASTKFVLLHDDMEQEQEMIKENRKEFKGCSSKQMTKITGMEICGELSFPNASMKTDSPYFPFTGPSSVSVNLFKRDSHSGYKLLAKTAMNKKGGTVQISFKTPGSRVDRAVSVDASLNYKKQVADLNIISPWKTLAMKGNLENTNNAKSLSGQVVIDDKDKYAMTGEVKISKSKNKIQFNPLIEFKRPGDDKIQLVGSMTMEKPLKAINMDMSLFGFNKLPFTIKSELVNNRQEKSIQARVSLDGKNEYVMQASNTMSLTAKKSTVKSSVEVKTPERKLVTLSNNVDYRQDKLLDLDTSLYIYRVLRKTANFKVELTKSSRRKSDKYKALIKVKSYPFHGKVDGGMTLRSRGLSSINSNIDYTIRKGSQNTITFHGKLNDRSTRGHKSYNLKSNVAIKRNPEYNTNFNVDLVLKRNVSFITMDTKYGQNKIYLSTSVKRKVATLKNADVSYNFKAKAPAHSIDIVLSGRHQHNPSLLDSSVKLVYLPNKEINAAITMKDESTKLIKMNGNAFVSWPGKKYNVETDLSQKSDKHFAHSVGFKSNTGTKHSMFTVYRRPNADSHDFSFDLDLHKMKPISITSNTTLNWKDFSAFGEFKKGQTVYASISTTYKKPKSNVFNVSLGLNLHKMKPISLRGSTDMNWKKFVASGEFKSGQNVYAINTLSKIAQKSKNAKMSFELIHPARHITVDIEGGKKHNKIDGKIEAAWDVDNDKSQKMSLDGAYFHKMSKGSTSLGGNLNFHSPFEKYENLVGLFRYVGDRSKHYTNGKLSWAKSQYIGSTMTVKKPISLRNLQLIGNIKTPFQGFRKSEIDIDHRIDSELSTSINGNLGKKIAKLSFLGKKLNNGYKGTMILKSTIKNAKSISLTASHTGNDGSYINNAELNHNGKTYGYNLTMSHSGNGWQRKTSGDLLLTLNKKKITTHWDHKNTDSIISSTISSKWNNQHLMFDLSGSHKLSAHRNIAGVMKLKSPWKPFRDIEFNIDHQHGTGLINSIVFFKQDSKKHVSSNIKYTGGQNVADFDCNIVCPFHKYPLAGKLSANYDNYPMTTSVEMKLSPKLKGTLEGSLNLASWNNADLNLKMTTPSRTIRNVVLKASNKKQNGELISQLNLDYGMKQNIDVESRISNQDQKKMLRFKLSSPFKQIKSLTTGLNFNGHAHNFDTAVDFELLPNLGKFDGVMNWNYDDEFNGKLRFDTPFPAYPYFELSTSKKMNGDVTKAHIQAEYYPRQVFNLDTNYKFDSPLSFDATIRSPYPKFNDIGMSLQHNIAGSSIKSQGEVQYQPGKKIKAEFNADWASDMEGNLVVKTPFSGYETNKISLRHRGQMNKFDSHGEIDVAQQNYAADASFNGGYHTSGTFTLSSPIPGFEKIDFALKKRGHMKNLKGSASISINDDKYQTTFNNKLTKDSLKTNFNLMTPYTDTFKINFDHSGHLESFTNKIGVNYGHKIDIDTLISFDLHGNDVNGNGILKYKIYKARNTARIVFSKSGSLDDISFTTTTSFNKDDFTVTGSLRTNDGVDGSIQIKTPIENFKNTGMTMIYSGDMTDFTGNTNINYMDNKNINGKFQFSNAAGIKLSGDLTTPFKDFESTSVEFNHDMNAYSDISGNGKLTTTICEFGTGDFTYKSSGDFENFAVSGSATYNGENMAELKTTNTMQNDEIHIMCSLSSAATPEIYLSFDHSGDSYSFNTQAVGKVGKNVITSASNMKTSYESISAESSLAFKKEGQRENKASISIQQDGPLDNGNMELSGKFNDNEVKISASRSGPLNDIRMSGSATYSDHNGIYHSTDINGSWKNTENIEGSLKLLTSFEDLRNFDISFSQAGGLSDFTSNLNINYLDNNKINGKVEFRGYSLDNVKFISELTTPFEDFEHIHMKLNNNYNRYTLELNGNAAIDTSIAKFGTAGITYTKTGSLSNLNINGNAMRNGVEVAELTLNNVLNDKELHFSFNSKSTKTPSILLTVDHNGDFTNMKSSARAKVGNENIVEGEAKLSQSSDSVDGEGKVTYNIKVKGYGTDEIILNAHKQGHLNNFNVELSGQQGAKATKITGNFKNEDNLSGDLTISTPLEGYKNIGLSFSHYGTIDKFNCDGKIIVADGEEFSGKIDFYRHQYKNIMAVVELNTPIDDYEYTKYEYRHKGQSDSFTCFSSLQYSNSQRISYDFSASASPKPQFTVTVKMPKQEYMASGSYENNWPKYSIDGKVDVGEGQSITLTGSLDASRDVVGVLTLSTPMKDFSNVGLNFHHSIKSNGIDSEGSLTFMDDKSISGKVQATMNKKSGDASLEVKTPFAGYEFTRYEVVHINNKKMKKVITKLIYGDNQKIVVDTYLRLKPNSEFSLAVSSPFNKDIETFVSFDNNWPKAELTSRLSPGNGDKYTLDGSFDASQDISGSLKIGTPFVDFNNIGMNFIHSGNAEKFMTEGKLNYMDEQEIFGKINFYRYMWRRIDVSVELNTPFNELENNKAEFNFEDNSNSISTTAALEYNNGQKLNGNVKITSAPNYEIQVTLNTPFDDANVISAQAALDLTAPNYQVLSSMKYGYNKAYSATGKLNLLSVEHLDGSFEVNTPVEGFESTKIEYEHKVDFSEVEGSIAFIYDNGKKMSCDIKSVISPNFDGTVTVKTPFSGYETMQGSTTFDSSYQRYETRSSLNLGQGNIFSLSSEFDYSIEPMKVTAKVNTPFKNFRNIEMELTHEGGLSNFKSTGFLSSPITNHINAKASLRYDSLQDMSAAASLQSSLEGFEDLKAEWKTSDVAGEMKNNVVLGWTSEKQISYDVTFHKQNGWNEYKMHTDVSISTPFNALQSANLQMDHSAQTDSYVEKMNFELNGDSLLDFDAEYKFNDRKSAELIVRQPWPMQYTASKYINDDTTDAEIFVNWNRNEPTSNVRMLASLTDEVTSYQMDNALDLSVEYASRKVGVVNKFSQKSSEVSGNGYIYWDFGDENKVYYDLQVNNNSRRRKQMVDGSFKLGLPTRTLAWTGSYSENAVLASTDSTFSWDADHDDTKQIGIKTNVRLGDIVKGDVTLSLPALKKEIRVDGQVMMNNGRVILDTTTDISYSKDSRKTLTLTSKLEDLSSHNSFNYSLALGLKHPYTNVNIEMNSHLGKSDEKMTFGVATNYLTSKRQMKNLALLSEINMLKKQISVQAFNPENKIELFGDIISESPFKARMLNKMDDVEAFRSDLTFDNAKKSFIFNSFYDSDMMTLTAQYPNKTAFNIDLTHHTPNSDQKEAFIAIRLNTSRLLHTRLVWRPDMMKDFKAYALPIVLEKAESAFVALTSLNDAVAEELGSKYTSIINELNDEMQPFINALEQELDFVAERMIEFSQKLRQMYYNNEYYLQNTGEGVLEVQARIERWIQQYTSSYKQMISTLRENIHKMRQYHMEARYKHFVSQNFASLVGETMNSLASLELYMAEADLVLKEYKNTMLELKKNAMDTILNATYVDYVADSVGKLQTADISPYISSFDIPSQYTNIASEIPSKIHVKLNNALDNINMGYLKEGVNEIYQQGAWAHKYWQLEENLQNYAQNILNTLKEIAEEEIKQYSKELKEMLQSPITVWDPKHGEIQADVHLPIEVKRLDRMPDFEPLVKKADKFVDTYLTLPTTEQMFKSLKKTVIQTLSDIFFVTWIM